MTCDAAGEFGNGRPSLSGPNPSLPRRLIQASLPRRNAPLGLLRGLQPTATLSRRYRDVENKDYSRLPQSLDSRFPCTYLVAESRGEDNYPDVQVEENFWQPA